MYATTPLGDRFQVTYDCEFWAQGAAGDIFRVVTLSGELHDMLEILQSDMGPRARTVVIRRIAIPGEPAARRESLNPREMGNLTGENVEADNLDAHMDDALAIERWGKFIDAMATYSDA